MSKEILKILDKQNEVLGSILSDQRDIKNRLLGNKAMKQEGLVDEHNDLKDDVEAIKLDVNESKETVKRLKWIGAIGTTVVGAIASTIAFFKEILVNLF